MPKRWRDLAAQVVPPMMERETMIVTVDTLSILYYEKMVGYAPSKLCGFVFASERINVGPKRGKFGHPTRTTEKNWGK